MSGFLSDIARELLQVHGQDMSRVTVVFPNQRAGLYLRQLLLEGVGGPVWSPHILSLRELVERESRFTLPDTLTLNFKLHQSYSEVMKSDETFEDFYYWGQMLLKDFDELDKYLVNPKTLYTDLSNQKELDAVFDFLSTDQKRLIEQFWRGFNERDSASRGQFLKVWRNLYKLYLNFNDRLNSEGLSYEGNIYRKLAEGISTHTWKFAGEATWFGGFNALTASEEAIISHFLDYGDSRMFWDVDAYYISGFRQEAGKFFREYRSKRVFAKQFPNPLPSQITSTAKDVEIIGVPQFVGQAKACASALGEYLRANPEADLRKIALILAEETLLLPVLHSLPDEVRKVNITMGFPLMFAPLTGFIEELIELIELSRLAGADRMFHFRPVVALLNNPLLQAVVGRELIDKLDKSHKLYWPGSELGTAPLTRLIFTRDPKDFITYLIDILEELSVDSGIDEMENTYIHHYLKHLARYRELMQAPVGVSVFRRLFANLARLDRIPFTGEPLEGIQIMGVLESRNLDFDAVFVLGMNEESFPGGRNQHSYIPYNLRKAYSLPHYDQQDAIYAYLFYRLFHHAGRVRLYYNTEGNDLGGEEMSRFLKQLIFEKPFPVKQIVLKNIPSLVPAGAVMVRQNEASLARLSRFTEGPGYLSPSAVKTYLDCRLKFYYRYVAGIREKDEREEHLDSRTLGLLIHHCMEYMYSPYVGKMVTVDDIRRLMSKTDEYINQSFRSIYHIDENEDFEPEGKNVVAHEVAMNFVQRMLDVDLAYAPFEVLGVEKSFMLKFGLDSGQTVTLGGNIDRIDRKNNEIRVLDLKTGSDLSKFAGVESFFDRSQKERNNAAFQTFFYSLLYPDDQAVIVPSVYNKNVLFKNEPSGFTDSKAKAVVRNFSNYRSEYTRLLRETIGEIFDPGNTFDQVEHIEKCEYCSYNTICQRS